MGEMVSENNGVAPVAVEAASGLTHDTAAKDSEAMTTPTSKRILAPRAWQTSNEHNNNFPDVPATYAIYADGEVVYIGQSIRLSARMSSYRIHVNLFDDPMWVTPWGSFEHVQVKYKLSHRYGDWLMREARLIRRLNPRFNQYGISKAVVR